MYRTVFCVCLSVACASYWGTVDGKVHPYTVELNAYAGGYFFAKDDDPTLRNSFVYGVRAGFNLPHDFGVELVIDHVPAIGDNTHMLEGYFEGVYHVYNKGSTVPFVTFGAGMDALLSKADRPNVGALLLTVGIGAKVFAMKQLGLRWDLRYVFVNAPDSYATKLHNISITVAFMYDFLVPD